MANNFNPWNQDSVEVKQEPDLESTEMKSELTEKSLVNPNFVELKQESELQSVEIKSEITEKSLVNHDLVEVKQESKRSKRFYRIKCINAMYKCNICGKSFRTEYGRLDHLKTCQKRQYQRSKI